MSWDKNMKAARGTKGIKAGDTVKVKGTKELIKVQRVVNGFNGNSIVLETPVRGFLYYNEVELTKVK